MSIYIQRDADPGDDVPDLLRLPSGNVRWLTRADTEALEPLLPDPSLPEGVHRAPDGRMWLAPEADLPEGWEWMSSVSLAWSRRHLGAGHRFAVQVRPIPAPKTERVPWQQSIGRTLSDGREIEGAWRAADGGPRIGIRVAPNSYLTIGGVPQPDADGTVEVLKDPS